LSRALAAFALRSSALSRMQTRQPESAAVEANRSRALRTMSTEIFVGRVLTPGAL